MSDLWYWRKNGRVQGPMVTEELEAVVLNQKLGEHDFFRIDQTSEWIPASEIRRLFGLAEHNPSATAADLLATAAHRRLQGTGAEAHDNPLRRLIAYPMFWGSALWERFSGGLSDVLSGGLDLIRQQFKVLVGIAVATLILVLVAVRFDLFRESDHSRLDRLAVMWTQRQDDPKGTWTEAEQAWLKELDLKLSKDLQQTPITGSSEARRKVLMGQREILFAARDMLRLNRKWTDSESVKISEHLESAESYLNGTADTKATRPGWRPGLARAKSQETGRISENIIIIGFLIIDAALLLAGAVWFFKRRSSRV